MVGGELCLDLQEGALRSLLASSLEDRTFSVTNLRDLDLQVEDYREEKKVGYR